MPSNYSFVDEYIAGSAYPNDLDDLKAFEEDGITSIISLTPRLPLVSKYYEENTIEFHHFPIYSTPDPEQIEDFITIVKDKIENNEKLVIHCQYGQERTGMFLAAYLVEIKNMELQEAIKYIQDNRTGSLQTHHALQFLRERYSQ